MMVEEKISYLRVIYFLWQSIDAEQAKHSLKKNLNY
jgi:hypothetical protein